MGDEPKEKLNFDFAASNNNRNMSYPELPNFPQNPFTEDT
jgi:hypothetical protein